MTLTVARPRTLPVRDLQRFVLFCLTASSFLAFIEPSPFEIVFGIAAVVLLVTDGLRVAPSLLPFVFSLLMYSLGGFICLLPYLDQQLSVMFTSISAYFCVAAIVFAAMLTVDGEGRLEALRSGYALAAVMASIAGIVGYFNIGGLGGILTLYGRASGTFKDPNVLGTFVILPLVYLVRTMYVDQVRPWRLLAAGIILFGGVFLSFSRGAWLCTVGALGLMTLLTYASVQSPRVRRRIVISVIVGTALLALALMVALSFESIRTVFETRASFNQDYDLGEQGRFGNQLNSLPALLDRPNGFGPLRFRYLFNGDPHNVFINAFASYGWLGGFSYLLLTVMTLVVGWRVACSRSPLQGHAIVIWSTLFFEILQGLQIDTDHWRHFWLMLGLIWGLVPAARDAASEKLQDQT